MANFTNTPPDWKANGVEPPESLKTTGFVAGYKPPASYFNWFWTKVSKCISELQSFVNQSAGKKVNLTDESGEVFNDYANNVATGLYSHAEGGSTTASGSHSHAEGKDTIASGDCSHAEGEDTIASSDCSHAEGCLTTAKGTYSHAGGMGTIANDYQTCVGRYNVENAGATGLTDTTGSIFMVGVGHPSLRRNALRISTEGKCYGTSSFMASGAGLSELYEWEDGNPNNEDRRGLFITLDGGKIRVATPQDSYILGVIDPCPFMVGDVQSEEWKNMFLKDIFGEKLTETVEVPETVDETTGRTIPAHTETSYIINPDYDPARGYTSRDERAEFTAITSKGKVVMIDDGTCKVNKYCTVGENGVATSSDNNYAVRVLERIDSTHIRVYIDSVFVK